MTTNYGELRQAEAKATPAPWETRRSFPYNAGLTIFAGRGRANRTIVTTHWINDQGDRDGEFIVLMRNNFLALLDENAALREVLCDAQWTHDPAGEYDWQFCPSCFGTEPRHQPDCGLAKALGDAS